MTPALTHSAFASKVKEEPVDGSALQMSHIHDVSTLPDSDDLAELRVNVDMANSTDSNSHNTPSTTSPDPSHSPISLPSFTVSSISSTPSSPIPADIEAMVNAIDFEFAATSKLLRPIRHRKRRRKVTEINPLEVWRCPHAPCEKIYKRTSSVSINRHKEVCEYRPGAAGTVKAAEASAASKQKSNSVEVLQLVQQLLSGEANGHNSLNQLMNLTSGGVSLEQLLTGALSEQLVKHITAQLINSPATGAVGAKAAGPSPTSTTARKRTNANAATVSELPELLRASSTPGTQAAAPLSKHKRIMITPPRENLLGHDTRTAHTEPSTPSTNGFNSLSLHSPASAPAASHLPHSTHHARSHSASLGRQHPQLIQGSFFGHGGLLTGLVGTVGNDLAKTRAANHAGEDKLDANAALSLKAAQVAMAQRELVASLYGHQQY